MNRVVMKGAMILCLALTTEVFAQSNSGENKSVLDDRKVSIGEERASGDLNENDWPFSLYKDIYFLVGYSNSALNKDLIFKFQLSAKFRIPIPGVYIAYTQRSFLDLLEDSIPFTDHNFEPEVYYIYSFSDAFAEAWWLRSVQAGYRHESNGQGDEVKSRSWERIYAEVEFKNRGFYFRPTIWFPFLKEAGNANVEESWGYGEFLLAYVWKNDIRVSGLFRLGTDWPKGSMKFDLTVPFRRLFRTLPVGWNQSNLWFQVFQGHGETFLGFDESSTAVAIGVGFRPSFR